MGWAQACRWGAHQEGSLAGTNGSEASKLAQVRRQDRLPLLLPSLHLPSLAFLFSFSLATFLPPGLQDTTLLALQPFCLAPKRWTSKTQSLALSPVICTCSLHGNSLGHSELHCRAISPTGVSNEQVGELPILLHLPISSGQPVLPHTFVSS